MSLMKLSYVACAVGIALSIAACSKNEVATAPAAVPVAPASAPIMALPDAGKLTTVSTTATGMGASAAEAVDEAIKLAIKQVNGVAVDMSSEQYKTLLAVAVGRDVAQLQAHAFSEYVAQQSRGVVSSFKVLKIEEPVSPSSTYKASIEANIAKFEAPTDSKKLKIVVGPIRFDTESFKVAGVAVPSTKVADEVRQQILDALTNTGRFSVLERDLSGDVQNELDMISSGQTPSAERSKISQAISADLIWTGKINAFSFSNTDGNWALAQRVINVATRQVQLSNILQDTVNSTSGKDKESVDSAKQKLETQLVSKVVSAILVRTFPVTVASRDGNNVVLSQGGQSVREGARYQLVSMGSEIKDPQTGQSLGRTEYDCCEVVVDKVGPSMAQGHLENIRMPLEQIQPGGLQLRDLNAVKTAISDSASKTGTGIKKVTVKRKEVDVFADDKGKW
jgi:curli biogenesis system outer membrane secretion channel CsgG